jgi:hypothetical protein
MTSHKQPGKATIFQCGMETNGSCFSIAGCRVRGEKLQFVLGDSPNGVVCHFCSMVLRHKGPLLKLLPGAAPSKEVAESWLIFAQNSAAPQSEKSEGSSSGQTKTRRVFSGRAYQVSTRCLFLYHVSGSNSLRCCLQTVFYTRRKEIPTAGKERISLRVCLHI